MPVKLNFRSKLILNARAQSLQSHQDLKSSITVRAPFTEEKQEQIEKNVDELRKKHAKLLAK
jgi:hypothetical protein